MGAIEFISGNQVCRLSDNQLQMKFTTEAQISLEDNKLYINHRIKQLKKKVMCREE